MAWKLGSFKTPAVLPKLNCRGYLGMLQALCAVATAGYLVAYWQCHSGASPISLSLAGLGIHIPTQKSVASATVPTQHGPTIGASTPSQRTGNQPEKGQPGISMFSIQNENKRHGVEPGLSSLSINKAKKRQRALQKKFRTRLPGCAPLPDPSTEGVIPRHYPTPANYSRGECKCTPVHNFVIITLPRSGSGWLMTFLNSNPSISTLDEIMYNFKNNNHSGPVNVSNILKVLDNVYNLQYKQDFRGMGHKVLDKVNTCKAAVGFKWMVTQGMMYPGAPRAILNYFLRNHVSVIFLVRRNQLRRLVSWESMNQFQLRSHVQDGKQAKALASSKPRIEVATLVDTLKKAEARMAFALNLLKPTRHMVVTYEQLSHNESDVSLRLQDFLGVPIKQLQSRQKKIHTKSLAESIQNYDDVAMTLKGSAMEVFLNDNYM